MEKVHFILFVADQRRSRDFYATVLASNPRLDVPGMTEFDLGENVVLGLMPAGGIKSLIGPSLPDPTAAAGIPRAELYLIGADPRTRLTRALAAGAQSLSPVDIRDWGHEVGYCLDLDGHVLAFAREEGSKGWIGLDQTIETERLALRALSASDAPDILRLAGDREIAATTAAIPHPYEEGMAEEWISTHEGDLRQKRAVHWAITSKDKGKFLGVVSLMRVDLDIGMAELGYWIGRPFWGRGYCTEAASSVVRFGFEVLGLERVHAHHFASNPSSGAVMRKIGMAYEGTLRRHVEKWGEILDAELYGILRSDNGESAEAHRKVDRPEPESGRVNR